MKQRSRTSSKEVYTLRSVEITNTVFSDDRYVERKETDCCFTLIKFKKLYPGDMTVRITTDTGRTIQKKFTKTKTERTTFIKKNSNDDDDDTGTPLPGELGKCVLIDVEIADTSTIAAIPGPGGKPVYKMTNAHYQFKLCCKDTRPGARLTHVAKPVIKGGQVVKLPLLLVTAVKKDACP